MRKCFANIPRTLWDYANALAVPAPTSYLDDLLVALKSVQSLTSVQFGLLRPGFAIISLIADNAHIISVIKLPGYFHHLTTTILKE